MDPLFKFYWLESTELTEDKQLIFKNRFNEILLRKWNSINSSEYSNNLIDSNNLINSNNSIPPAQIQNQSAPTSLNSNQKTESSTITSIASLPTTQSGSQDYLGSPTKRRKFFLYPKAQKKAQQEVEVHEIEKEINNYISEDYDPDLDTSEYWLRKKTIYPYLFS